MDALGLPVRGVGVVTRPTIEDVLARTEVCGEGLFTATADGPIVSADGQLVVQRADLELVDALLGCCARMFPPPPCDDPECAPCRAARLVAGDPEGES